MDYKNITNLLKLLLVLFLISIELSGCAATRTPDKKGKSSREERVIRDFIRTSYDQSIEELTENGLDLEKLKKNSSSSYYIRLSDLSKSYKLQRESFSEFEKEKLARIFSSEMNFSVLRPWSYRPDLETIRILSSSSGKRRRVLVSFEEQRWHDVVTTTGYFVLNEEEGSLKIDDLSWKNQKTDKSVGKSLREIARILSLSSDLSEYERKTQPEYWGPKTKLGC